MASPLSIRSEESSRFSLNEPNFGRLTATDNAQGAQLDADGMSVQELESFLMEIRDEPRWRERANKCADYYDNNQLTDEVLAELNDRGLPPLIINLIAPTVNTVLGMEAKTRTDSRVDFEDEQYEETAIALNAKLTTAERDTSADQYISNAYAGQIKAGLHWVEVGYNNRDPLGPSPYRVRDVHRREIWWDWRYREPSDWRYLVRKQWFDQDQLLLAFPQFQDLIMASLARWGQWNFFAQRLDESTGLGQAFDLERAFTLEAQEWKDTERKRAMLFEVWYRRWKRGYIARLPNGRAIELDIEKNARHAYAVATGAITPRRAIYPVVRQALYIGPHRVLDRPTPLPHREFPYVPFFGYREDLSNAPYGLILGMLSPQDEINARRSKMLALMSSRRVQMDSDAVDLAYNSVQDVADEASRHDSVIVTNPNRKNAGGRGVVIDDNRDLSAQQFEVLQESKNNIHDTSGVFPPMVGDNRGGLSGIAISSLVEQGTQTLAEINDNYSFARRKVFELLLEHVKADSLHEHNVPVGEGRAKRSIVLNQRDPQTGEITANDVAEADVKLVLEEVPSTPSYRAQESAQLAEVVKSLPPNVQAFVAPFWLESTNIRDRKKMASVLRRQLGLPEPGAEDQQDPQVQALQQQLGQFQQEHQAAVADLSAKLQAAMNDAQVAKAKLANRDVEAAAKAKTADAAVRASDAKVALDTMNTLARVEQAEFPKGGGADNSAALQDALEELIATVRASHSNMEDRFATLEKRLPASAPQPAPAPAPAAPPAA